MAIPISYNVRNVLQRPVSTLTTAFGVGLTVMIFIGALSLAEGIRTALVQTGSASNAIVLRERADSARSSGVSLEAVQILRAHPPVAPGPDGRPLLRAARVAGASRPARRPRGASTPT